jgi:hypothetical protein
MGISRNVPRLAVAVASVVLWALGCSSENPGVAGVACPAGASTAFTAPSLMTTTGGEGKAVRDLLPPAEGSSAALVISGDGDPCRRHPPADAGTDADSATE